MILNVFTGQIWGIISFYNYLFIVIYTIFIYRK